MKVSRAVPVALPLTLLAAFTLTGPASSQAPASTLHTVPLSGAERRALEALAAVAAGNDRVAQDAALTAARSAVSGAGGRHALAHYQLQIAQSRQDQALALQAVDMLVSSGLSTTEELVPLLLDQARRAYYAGEHRDAERLLAAAVASRPGDPVLLAEQAQLKSQIAASLVLGGRQPEAQALYVEAVAMLQRAIALQKGAGQAVPESWYKRALGLSFDRNLAGPTMAFAHDLVASYPGPINWRDALLAYRRSAETDPALVLDIVRLQRASGSLAGERDYLELAGLLEKADLAGEEKAVLDEGVRLGMLAASEPIVRQKISANARRLAAERSGMTRLRSNATSATTGEAARIAGDTYLGLGQHAEAAELYGLALQKGGVDPNLINSRLGAALALSGRRPEAEAAFRSIAGPRADLARFWLTWLASPAA